MRILFQGDSITDAGRDRNDPHHLGGGYPKYAAKMLQEKFPETSFEFLNFGVSGDLSRDLVARWEEDCLRWQPDLVSILVGINDTWRGFGDIPSITTAAQFEQNYRTLLTGIREKTNAKIVLLEQFLVPVDATKDCWRAGDLDEKIQVTRRLAREFADVFIPVDGLLASECVKREPVELSRDGVHLEVTGARLVGGWYADAVAPYIV